MKEIESTGKLWCNSRNLGQLSFEDQTKDDYLQGASSYIFFQLRSNFKEGNSKLFQGDIFILYLK